MRAYLATTGALFGLLALLHAWRVAVEWRGLLGNPWSFIGVVGVGVLAAALCVWAWRLLRRSAVPETRP